MKGVQFHEKGNGCRPLD